MLLLRWVNLGLGTGSTSISMPISVLPQPLELNSSFWVRIKNKVNQKHQEISLGTGYRWNKNFLHYTNFVYHEDLVSGNVTNLSGSLSDTPFEYRHSGGIYSTGLIHYFAKAHWKLDYSYYTCDWTKTRKHPVNSLSAGLGFDW
jgi:hypothetical protein